MIISQPLSYVTSDRGQQQNVISHQNDTEEAFQRAVANIKTIRLSRCKWSPKAMAVWSLRFIILRERQRLYVASQTMRRSGV